MRFLLSPRKLTTTKLFPERSVSRSVISSTRSTLRPFHRLQADMHRLQPIHLPVSTSFPYRREIARADPLPVRAKAGTPDSNFKNVLRFNLVLIRFFYLCCHLDYRRISSILLTVWVSDAHQREAACLSFWQLPKNRPDLQVSNLYDGGSCYRHWAGDRYRRL